MRFCFGCGAQLVAGASFCTICGVRQELVPAGASGLVVTAHAHANALTSEETLVRQIADYERISGIVWIVLGVLQILSLVGVFAGIWNIFAGRSRLKLYPLIAARDASVPAVFESLSGLVVIGIINILLGGFIGVICIGFDFYIREKVLSNAHLFRQQTQTLS